MELPSSIDSKFSYILIAAKRARQLQSGVRPLVQSSHMKATKIAMQEVSAGLIPIEAITAKPDDDGQEN